MAADEEVEELLQKEEEEGEEEEVEEETKKEKVLEQASSSRVKRLAWSILDAVFPTLTTNSGKIKLTRKRSFIILFLLYISHIFSSWGDRMWGFAISLVVVLLYPGSLLLPAIYGFLVKFFVVIFATIVGDLVDTNPRMRVICVSLLVQNGLIAISTVIFSFMFYYSMDVCSHRLLFGIFLVAVILLGSTSNLATVANTISIEKDWVVVIADKNSNTLAVLNANMRRIDLLCKLLAPIAAGVLLAHTKTLVSLSDEELASGFVTTVVIGSWNVISFFGELSILIIVYYLVPALSIKKLRKKSLAEDNSEDDNSEEVKMKPSLHQQTTSLTSAKCIKILSKLASPYRILLTGWKIFWRQEINLVGFALASLYLTVLGFSGVTATYFLTQGLSSDLIGLAQGIGGIFGISGTLVYPFLKRRVGTVRAGLFGICMQVSMLLFCVVGVFVPGRPPTDPNKGYYSPTCNNESYDVYLDLEGDDYNAIISLVLILVGVIGARFGLWMFDLSVWQLVQERVVEEERGVVSGVMNAMNSNMDMLHYVLVIIAPRPQDFRYLTLVSFASVSMGLIFYCFYVRRSRGHFFHCQKIFKCCNQHSTSRHANREPQLTFVNSVTENEDENL